MATTTTNSTRPHLEEECRCSFLPVLNLLLIPSSASLWETHHPEVIRPFLFATCNANNAGTIAKTNDSSLPMDWPFPPSHMRPSWKLMSTVTMCASGMLCKAFLSEWMRMDGWYLWYFLSNTYHCSSGHARVCYMISAEDFYKSNVSKLLILEQAT